MNSFEVNTLPYIVSTLFTYKTSDRYKGFRIQLKEEEEEKEEDVFQGAEFRRLWELIISQQSVCFNIIFHFFSFHHIPSETSNCDYGL